MISFVRRLAFVSRLSLVVSLGTMAGAQTSSSTTHRPVHRTTGARSSAAAATRPNPADNPPNVPPVSGLPKPMYALRYVDTRTGTGELAVPQMFYTVRYTSWLTDGTKFDSSEDHPGKEPITFPYGARRVIAGWDTGFEGMRVGGKRRLYIPYQLAYGPQGKPPAIPAKANLIFDIELVGMSATPPAPPIPAAAPSSGATPPPPPPSTTAPQGSSIAPSTQTPQTATPTPPPAAKPETTPQH